MSSYLIDRKLLIIIKVIVVFLFSSRDLLNDELFINLNTKLNTDFSLAGAQYSLKLFI